MGRRGPNQKGRVSCGSETVFSPVIGEPQKTSIYLGSLVKGVTPIDDRRSQQKDLLQTSLMGRQRFSWVPPEVIEERDERQLVGFGSIIHQVYKKFTVVSGTTNPYVNLFQTKYKRLDRVIGSTKVTKGDTTGITVLGFLWDRLNVRKEEQNRVPVMSNFKFTIRFLCLMEP